MRPKIRIVARTLGLAVLAVVLSGCFHALALKHQSEDPDTRPWWCESHPGHDMGHGGHEHDHHPVYDDVEKGMLSWDDCLELSQHLDEARAFAMQWPTLGEAEADGWSATVNYTMGMGTHHVRDSALEGSFDPGQPRFLQYGGDHPDAPLVGMSWYVDNGPDEPPAGFPGDNDWWHTHEYLCFSGGVVVYDGTCAEGGVTGFTIYLGNYWMVHAWILPDMPYLSDLFVNHHTCLGMDGPIDYPDECWEPALSREPLGDHHDDDHG
jgi:hypothetical protein